MNDSAIKKLCVSGSALTDTSAFIRAGSEIKRWTDADLKDDSLWLMKDFRRDKT